jgi:hypothetical protein
MKKKLQAISLVILALLFMGMAGCAKKNVRHLASDVCLITPDQTSKEQVLAYLGLPDEQYEMADGSETWVYYDVRKTMLRDTPYIGEKIGEQKYEMVKVKFGGDIVQTCVYRLLTEEEFKEGGQAK